MKIDLAFKLTDDEHLIETQVIDDVIYAASNRCVYMLEYRGTRAVMSPIPFVCEESV